MKKLPAPAQNLPWHPAARHHQPAAAVADESRSAESLPTYFRVRMNGATLPVRATEPKPPMTCCMRYGVRTQNLRIYSREDQAVHRQPHRGCLEGIH